MTNPCLSTHDAFNKIESHEGHMWALAAELSCNPPLDSGKRGLEGSELVFGRLKQNLLGHSVAWQGRSCQLGLARFRQNGVELLLANCKRSKIHRMEIRVLSAQTNFMGAVSRPPEGHLRGQRNRHNAREKCQKGGRRSRTYQLQYSPTVLRPMRRRKLSNKASPNPRP